jgi:hypothetical protein
MYPYVTLADETLITHSHLLGDEENPEVKVHFERPADNGFDSVTYMLPHYTQTEKIGNYSEKEISRFERMLRDNAHLFFRFADEGGHGIA